MFIPERQIGLTAVFALIINACMEMGVLTLPSDLAHHLERDAWIGVLISTALTFVSVFFITTLALESPKESFAQYTPKLLGSVLGFLLNWLFYLLLVSSLAIVTRTLGDTVNVVLLRRTPLEVTMLAALLVAIPIARNGLVPLSRMSLILLFVYVIPFLLLPLMFSEADLGRFRPILMGESPLTLMGILAGMFAFFGFETVLVIMPDIYQHKGLLRTGFLSISFVGLLYLFFTASCIAVLSATETAKLRYPFVEVLKYVPVPVLVVERIELLIFSIWIASAYSTIAILLYLASRHFSQILGKDSQCPYVLPSASIAMILTRIPENVASVSRIVPLVNTSWLALSFGVVPLLILLSRIKKRKKKNAKRVPSSKRKGTKH